MPYFLPSSPKVGVAAGALVALGLSVIAFLREGVTVGLCVLLAGLIVCGSVGAVIGFGTRALLRSHIRWGRVQTLLATAAVLAAFAWAWWWLPFRERVTLHEAYHEIKFSPDGNAILTVGADYRTSDEPPGILWGDAIIWDVRTGKKRFSVPMAGNDLPLPVVFSPDGKQLVALQNNGFAKALDVKTGVERFSFPFQGIAFANAIAFSPNGDFLAVPDSPDEVRLIDAENGQPVAKLGVMEMPLIPFDGIMPNPYRFSPNGKVLARIVPDQEVGQSVQLWDVYGRKELAILKGAFAPLVFSPHSKAIATGLWNTKKDRHWDMGTTFALWDMATGRRRIALARPLPVFGESDFAFSPDGQTVVIFDQKEKCVHLWDVATGKLRGKTPPEETDDFFRPAFSPDGKQLLIRVFVEDSLLGVAAENLRVWNLAANRTRLYVQNIREMYPIPEQVDFFFTPDSNVLAFVAGPSEDLTFFDMRNGVRRSPLSLRDSKTNSQVTYIGSTPDSKSLVMSFREDFFTRQPNRFIDWIPLWVFPSLEEEQSKVVLFDVSTGKSETILNERGAVLARLSPDGKTLATLHQDDNGAFVKLWDIPPRKPLEWLIVPAAVLAALILVLRRVRRTARVGQQPIP